MTQATAATASSTETLRALIDKGAGFATISAYLDGLSKDARLSEMLGITHGRVGKLYDCVKDAPGITIDDFFPKDTPDDETLIFEGRNSLPMFTRFQKRFCRRKGVVVGYNHQTMSFFTGPGFFVLTEADDTHPGEIIMDYTKEPTFDPPGWPTYKHNESGFSKLVYANMKDYCRRVAKGIIVGAAFKKGVPQNAYFTLTRG